VKDLIDKKVLEATDKLGRQLLASIALYTDATIGEVRVWLGCSCLEQHHSPPISSMLA
jgi:hypothetical protein